MIKINWFKWIGVCLLIFAVALATPFFSEAEDVKSGMESNAVSGSPNAVPTEQAPVFTSRVAESEQGDDNAGSSVSLPEMIIGESIPGGDQDDVDDDSLPGEDAVATPIWERLAALDAADKANAIIELEIGKGASVSDPGDIANAEALWADGDFDRAIVAIQSLEEAGAEFAVGISWKTPKSVVNANWLDNDVRIGARTQISETHLDYDAQTGNQFAVLRYRDGSTTEWYWSVNFSSDGGETWTETYSWFANFEIKDTAAAVVDDYLWVGYVHNTTFDDARIRRFFVSDGAVDFFYGFQTVFNKGVAIKEIALNANADDHDNRLYYWAILEDASPVTAAVEQSPPEAVHKDYPNVSSGAIQMGTTEEMLAQLEDSPKLYSPETILDDFQAGYTMTRVIVDLRDPDVTMATRAVRSDFQDLAVQQVVAQEVNAAQTNVIDAMDANEVNITNQFDYIFSFSAEVTVAGLAALANHPDVVFIKEDGILEPHLAQGIPLMNGTTARSTYNGSGMSIAICDTGIDYTHSRLGGGGFPNTKVIGGYDTGQNDTDPMDGNGHGTACAGIAAGDLGTVGDYIGGVAYNARLYALKISFSSTGGSAYESDFVEAVEWCITHQNDDPSNPIMVISTSFGGYYYNSQASCDAYWPSMTTAVANAKSAGMTLFYSTGNDGFTDGTGWPGCLSDVVGVGAVYDANIGSYLGSCYDATTAADQVTCYSSSASFMSLFAPSHDAYTTTVGGGFRTDFGGTSAACPYAAGSGAALQSAAMALTGAYLTPDQVQSTLENTGDPITDPKAPTITKPRVNLGNAVEAISTDNLILYYGSDLATTTPSWTEYPTGVTNALHSLDATWNEDYNLGADYFLYASYIASDNSDNPIMVLRIDGSTVDLTQVLSDYTGTSTGGTSISAYSDTVICAYENLFTNGYGIRYSVSYDGGGSWGAGTFSPDVGQDFYNPAVTLRGGQGSAMVHDEEAGAFDPVWFRYRDHYSSGPWNAEEAQINNNDTATLYPNSIEYLPPAGGTYAYGAIYLDGSPNPWFDRSDFAGGGYGDELAVDFGGNGLWHYDASWAKLSNWNVDSDLAGWHNGLGVDFGGNGLWNHDGSSWSKLSNWNADSAGLAGWSNGLAVDFNGNGLWNHDGSSWNRMSTWNPDDDLAGWSGGLAVDFGGNGLWNGDGSSWSKLSNWNADSAGLVGWNDGLAVDFNGNGLWNYDGSIWSRMSTWDPEDDLAGWPGGLAVDFGGNGLWNHDGSSWSRLSNWNPEGMTGVADGLVVDFGLNGMWKYNGSSWSRFSTWNAENMEDCDLN